MQLTYGIKNFRVFDTKGSTFNLKPITILTGANSSGKSSLVKSILLFKKYLDCCIDQPDLDPEKYRLSFSDKDVNINGINSVLNWNAGDNHDIVFSVTMPHEPSNVHFSIEYTFSSGQSDILNDGWLKRLSCYCCIEDNKELFLDVAYDNNGNPSFRTLNLSGNIYKSFVRDLELSSYAILFDQCAFNETDDELEEINKKKLIEIIKSNPLNKGLDLSFDLWVWEESLDDHKKNNERRTRNNKRFYGLNANGVSYECLMNYTQNGVLLYLPVLDELWNMSPSKLEAFFSQISIDDSCFDIICETQKEPFEGILHRIIDDFKHSGTQTFIKYYKGKEKEALENVGMINIPNSTINWKDEYLNRHAPICGIVNKVEWLISMMSSLKWLEYYRLPHGIQNNECASLHNRPTVDFYMIYYVLSYFQRKACYTGRFRGDFEGNECYEYNDAKYIKWIHHVNIQDVPESEIFIEFKSYVTKIINKLLKSHSFNRLKHIESFLCPIQRCYSKYELNNTLGLILTEYVVESERLRLNNTIYTSMSPTTILRRKVAESEYLGLIDTPTHYQQQFKCGSFMNKWIKLLGIGSSASIKMSDDSTSYRLFIRSARKKAISSADMGHGITQLLSILLNIEVQIIRQAIRGNDKERCTLCFEEPEVSLHPSWQSKLAEIFFDAYKSYGIEFIIETHSEYMLRKSQVMVNKMNFTNEKELLSKNHPFSVYYFDNQGRNKPCYEMIYRIDGKFSNQFGPGFFDESTNLLFEIL